MHFKQRQCVRKSSLDLTNRNMVFRIFSIWILILLAGATNAQDIYQHTSKYSIYEFLDEVAAQKLIEINSAIKPYSRRFIANRLVELEGKREELNKRQSKELDFFLKDFGKEAKREELNAVYNEEKFFSKKTWFHTSEIKRLDALFFSSDKFQVSVNPIIGLELLATDNIYRRTYGGEVNAYLGKGFSAYFSFRDVSENQELIDPNYFNTLTVGVNRPNREKDLTDFSEVRGGITYSWNWGTIGLIQDQFMWGNTNKGANIFSGNFPAIPQIKLQVKPIEWLEFNYIHGWLNSDVIDSTRTYIASNGGTRYIFRQKAIAANMFTLKPTKGLHISFGNSTVYSDYSFNPAYLIPFFFYRSVDHAQSSQSNKAGQNGQLFLDISSRNIKNVHLYGTLFIDEMKFSVFFDKERQRNELGFKLGTAVRNVAKSNIGLVAEYTRSNPYAYKHGLEATTFANNSYNLGHYLTDNADELYIEVNFKPLAKLRIEAFYLKQRKGPDDYGHLPGFGGFKGIPFMEEVRYSKTEFGGEVQYEIFNDMYVKAMLSISDMDDQTDSYSPSFMEGKNTFAWISFNWGF